MTPEQPYQPHAGQESLTQQEADTREDGSVVSELPACWIWAETTADSSHRFIYARKHFFLRGRPRSASVRIAASAGYKLYVDGELIGATPSTTRRACWDHYDLPKFTDRGKHVIAVMASCPEPDCESEQDCVPGFACKLRVEFASTSLIVSTDANWKAQAADDRLPEGEIMLSGLGRQETVALGKVQSDWFAREYYDRSWSGAVVLDSPENLADFPIRPISTSKFNTLVPESVFGPFNSAPMPRETPVGEVPELTGSMELKPLKAGAAEGFEVFAAGGGPIEFRSSPRDGRGVTLVLDFGRQVSGFVEMSIASEGSGVIDVAYGDRLEDGHVRSNLGGARFSDRMILTKCDSVWNSFDRRAFRYMQIEVRRLTKTACLRYVAVHEAQREVDPAGVFECDDEAVNRIWQAGVRTATLCTEDTFIPSPALTREPNWADLRILARAAYYGFGDTELFAQAVGDYADLITSRRLENPDLALLWMLSLIDLCEFTQDVEVAVRYRDVAESVIQRLRRFVGPGGLITGDVGELYLDRLTTGRGRTSSVLNSLYARGLQCLATVRSIAGDTQTTQELIDEAAEVKRVINRDLYSRRHGLYLSCLDEADPEEYFSKLGNAVVAFCDVPEFYEKSAIVRLVAAPDHPDEEPLSPLAASFIVEAMCAQDRREEALELIRSKWNILLTHSETLGGSFDGSSTLIRGYACSVVRDLVAEIVGIKPTLSAGRYTVSPQLGGLKWVRGSVATPSGKLTVEHKTSRFGTVTTVRVPKGTVVDYYIAAGGEIDINVDGRDTDSRSHTLEAGSHQIKVAEAKAARTRSLGLAAPKAVKKVEVLAGVSQLGRGQALRRGRRPGRSDDRVSGETEVLTFGDDDSATDIEATEVLDTETDILTEAPKPQRRQRPPRGPRRKPDARSEQPAEPTEKPASAIDGVGHIEVQRPEPDTEPATPAGQTSDATTPGAPKRRRRPRRPTRKPSDAEPVESPEVVEMAPPNGVIPTGERNLGGFLPAVEMTGPQQEKVGEHFEVLPHEVTDADAEPAPSATRRRRRPRRSGRKPSESQAEGTVEIALPEPEHTHEEPPAAAGDGDGQPSLEGEPRPKRPRSRSRRPRRSPSEAEGRPRPPEEGGSDEGISPDPGDHS